jgi:hypothetical protein
MGERRKLKRVRVANKLWLQHNGRGRNMFAWLRHYGPEMSQRVRREWRRNGHAWRSWEDQRRRHG